MPNNKLEKQPKTFDSLGNIAIVKFSRQTTAKEKKKFGEKILRAHKSVRTILEKTGKFKGRLRKQKTRFVTGEKTKEILYHENNCVFRFNVDEVYFSQRLSSERKEIASLIKKPRDVLIMFAGVAPYSIVIAKNSKANKVWSNEINNKANKYAELNIELNKLKGKVILLPGDIKKIAKKLSCASIKKISGQAYIKIPKKFDYIVMPRPQLKDSFLHEAFMLSKKGTRIFYYDFCKENEINLIVEKINSEAEKSKKKIKILKIKKAGEIGPYKYRVRIDFVVL